MYLLVHPNRVYDGETLVAASSEATGFPESNLSNSRVYSRWQSADAAAVNTVVDVDLVTAKPVDLVWLAGFNGSDAAEWRIRFDDNAGFASPSHDSGQVDIWASQLVTTPDPPWGRVAVYRVPTTQAQRYVRVEIFDAANPDGFLAAGVIGAAPAWEPVRSHSTLQTQAIATGADGHPRYARTVRHSFPGISESDAVELESIARELGLETPVLVVPREDRTDRYLTDNLWATLGSLPTTVNVGRLTNLFTATLSWREVSQ